MQASQLGPLAPTSLSMASCCAQPVTGGGSSMHIWCSRWVHCQTLSIKQRATGPFRIPAARHQVRNQPPQCPLIIRSIKASQPLPYPCSHQPLIHQFLLRRLVTRELRQSGPQVLAPAHQRKRIAWTHKSLGVPGPHQHPLQVDKRQLQWGCSASWRLQDALHIAMQLSSSCNLVRAHTQPLRIPHDSPVAQTAQACISLPAV